MFSQFGPITNVQASRAYRLRGQAWVTFADPSAVPIAVARMQGFPFFNKPLRLSPARALSDAVRSKAQPRWEADKEARRERAREQRLRLSFRGRERKEGLPPGTLYERHREAEARKRGGGAAAGEVGGAAAGGFALPGLVGAPGALGVPAGGVVAGASAAVAPVYASLPSILLVEGIPPSTSEAMLAMLFRQYPGFLEASSAGQPPGRALVRFDGQAQARAAVAGLDGFKLATDRPLRITVLE